MNIMKGVIEMDILVHLGEFMNVDLLQRGTYIVEASLLYGLEQKKILPIGLFSAPTYLESYVGEISVRAFHLTLR